MDRMRSRRLAVVTTLALLIGFVPTFASVCVGWEASAQKRMACCAKSDAATSSAKVDDCCRDGEGRSNAVAPGTLAAAAVPVSIQVDVVLTLPSIATFGQLSDSSHRSGSAPLYLLDSVFRL